MIHDFFFDVFFGFNYVKLTRLRNGEGRGGDIYSEGET